MKKQILLFLAATLSIAVFAQTTDQPKPDTTEIIGLVVPIVVAVYELVVRIVPTASNWSILTLIMKIIKGLVPNKKTDGKTHD
jgi:hypothetical protein